MIIENIEILPIRIPYKHNEESSVIDSEGISNVLIKMSTNNGLVGWGECAVASDTNTIISLCKSLIEYFLGESPYKTEKIFENILVVGRWRYQNLITSFILPGFEMAIYDIICNSLEIPLYNLFGGPIKDKINYFYYLRWTDYNGLKKQCEEGINEGYSVFYLKIGLDSEVDEKRIDIIRETIGKKNKLRIDANQNWTIYDAKTYLIEWHKKYNLDFVEGVVKQRPINGLSSLKNLNIKFCADEGLRGEEYAYEMVLHQSSDILCISPYDVGSFRKLYSLCILSSHLGQVVCKHTWGELGIAASFYQQLFLCIPNLIDGNQQTAQLLSYDVLKNDIPIKNKPNWELEDSNFHGIEIDEYIIKHSNKDFNKHGQFSRNRKKI